MVRYIWLKFCIEYKYDLDVDWYQNEKKILTELGHSDHLKICVNSSKIYVSPGFKSIQMTETTAPLILKFHMQHDKAAGLQENKISAVRESNISAVATNS